MRADVLVIGAGAAGLACASSLRDAGRSVVVLEAGAVVGGRIRSHRSDSGAIWEMGAQVVHDRSNPVWSTFPPAGLEAFGDNEFRCLVGGRRLPLSALAQLSVPPWMIVPALAAASPPITGSVALWLAGLAPSSRKLGLEWLAQDWASGPAAFDVVELLDIASAPGALGGEAVVTGGWDRLPVGLALGLDVRLSTPVRRLTSGADGVRVDCEGGEFSAAAAVVTVPPWTVGGRGLQIDGLPAEKATAAAGLTGGDAVVAVVTTDVLAPVSASVFDGDHGWGFLRVQRGHRDVQIVAKGPGAQRLRSVLADPGSAPDVVGAVLGQAFGGGGAARVTGIAVADWGSDPYIGGAFTAPGPGRAWHSATWASPWGDRVFFAGESTCAARGVGRVHGALRSGLRAAAEVLTALPFTEPSFALTAT